MFGNAILPPLTFNSNEEHTGQGASLCDKQTPGRGLARVRGGMDIGVLEGHTHPQIHDGKANPAGGQGILSPPKACLKLRRQFAWLS